MVAAMPFIRDDSMDKRFVDHWNQATKSARSALLKDAGRNTHYKQRAWEFVPRDIRIDVVTIIKRKDKASTHPLPKTTAQKFWWNEKPEAEYV